MKIKPNVINTYMQLCPLSTSKCESFADIEYRIERGVSLGQVIEIRNGEFVVGYYHLAFVVRNAEVVDMYKGKNNKYIRVSEQTKAEYDQVHMKMVV